jgi:hypothetical protein
VSTSRPMRFEKPISPQWLKGTLRPSPSGDCKGVDLHGRSHGRGPLVAARYREDLLDRKRPEDHCVYSPDEVLDDLQKRRVANTDVVWDGAPAENPPAEPRGSALNRRDREQARPGGVHRDRGW